MGHFIAHKKNACCNQFSAFLVSFIFYIYSINLQEKIEKNVTLTRSGRFAQNNLVAQNFGKSAARG